MDNNRPYQNLAHAIIVEACDEYRRCRISILKLKRDLTRYTNQKILSLNEQKELEEKGTSIKRKQAALNSLIKWFRSGFYMMLTSVDGNYIVNRLNKECDKFMERYDKRHRGSRVKSDIVET